MVDGGGSDVDGHGQEVSRHKAQVVKGLPVVFALPEGVARAHTLALVPPYMYTHTHKHNTECVSERERCMRRMKEALNKDHFALAYVSTHRAKANP